MNMFREFVSTTISTYHVYQDSAWQRLTLFLLLALENAALAASGIIYDNIMEQGEENFDGNAFMEAVFVLQ